MTQDTSHTIGIAPGIPISLSTSTGSTATKRLSDTRLRFPSTNDKVYQFAYVNKLTGSLVRMPFRMNYAEAVTAVGATGVANSVASTLNSDHPGLWGVYTNDQAYAKALAASFGGFISPPEVHGSGFYGHYHDFLHRFHVWFGGQLSY